MKTIEYKVKDTKAYTQYRELQSHDKKYLMNELRNIISLADECISHPQQSLKTIGIKMKTPVSTLPRQGKINNGVMNSIYTAASGIVDNIENGTQRDFSNHSCKLIEKTFNEMIKIDSNWEQVEFVEVESFTKPTVAPQPKDTTETTFSDMFEIESITFRRK